VNDFTQTLKWWDARQYAEDYFSGNTEISRIICGLVYVAYYYGTLARWERWGRPARWLYDCFQKISGGVPFPRRTGKIPAGQLTPNVSYGLKPGDTVRVKSYREILLTLDTQGFNRGLHWDAELVPYCGKTYRVKTRVERFVDEKTGRLKKLKTPAVILDGVYCRSRYSNRKMFCPRAIYSWWREIWLERVLDAPQVESKEAGQSNDPRPRFGSMGPGNPVVVGCDLRCPAPPAEGAHLGEHRTSVVIHR
jgi:hypothetical protein